MSTPLDFATELAYRRERLGGTSRRGQSAARTRPTRFPEMVLRLGRVGRAPRACAAEVR